MKRTFWVKAIIVVLTLFSIVSVMFIFATKDHPYLGIRAKKERNGWVVKKLQSGGVASQTSLKKGDKIVQIDHQHPEKNDTLTKWLIVEGISEIEVSRAGEIITIVFPTKNNVLIKQLLFTGIAFICLLLLFLFPTIVHSSTTYRLFFLFVTSLSFALISVIPSSMGMNLARVIIIVVMTFFPYYFLKFSHYKKNDYSKITIFSKVFAVLGFINLVALSLHLFSKGNYWLSEYLAIGIIYEFGVSLLILVMSSLVFATESTKNEKFSQVNLPVITILSFIPFFFFYVFPLQSNAPFHLVILFILFPLLAIIHLLFINRLIKKKKKMSVTIVYCFMAIGTGGMVWLLIELGKYIPSIYLVVYMTILIYGLLPLLSEFFLLMNKKITGSQGIQIFTSVEEERENISTFIHDTIIQEVIFEMNQLDQKDAVTIKEVTAIFDEIIYNLRELCTHIYPLMIQEIGIENTLKKSINTIQQKYPVEISLTSDSKIEQLPFRIKNFVLRTIREAITNSIKHGKSTKIDVTLFFSKDKFILEVYDNGRLQKNLNVNDHHFGIHFIREKVKMLEGSVLLSEELGRTKFQLELPMNFEQKKGE